MRFQLGIQILLLIVAVIIAFVVIRPKFAEIRIVQNEIVAYRNAIENIGKYNQRLQTLINQANAMSASDRNALYRYLPEEIDVVAVSRDITNIIERNRLLLVNISFDEATPVTAVATDGAVVDPYLMEQPVDPLAMGMPQQQAGPYNGLYSQRFEVEVAGTYEQMKAMMQDFERNSYPLRLVEFTFSLEEAGSNLIQYSFTLETYSLPAS